MPYFNFDNRKVYYKTTGNGEPLLLLHGNTASSKMFATVKSKYAKHFKLILIDFPGHGKSERLDEFETDFWFYNAEACFALIEELKIDTINVIGTSGGALVGINLALAHPRRIKHLIADSFEGDYPLGSYNKNIESDRERDKKKFLAKLFWYYNHGFNWKKVVDQDTQMNIDFFKTGNSFFHNSISDLKVPTLITGSLKDEYCSHLDKIYDSLQEKNKALKIHLFKEGNHPAMLSNKDVFFELALDFIKK